MGESPMGRYDITNDEQLRILNDRLDELRGERQATDARIDRLVEQAQEVTLEWQTWRKSIEQRLAEAAEAVAERLSHPLMDPETVEEMRRAQRSIDAHLQVQDNAIAALTKDVNRRLVPFERVAETLETLTKRLSWVLIAFGGGVLYEVGKIVVDRWLK